VERTIVRLTGNTVSLASVIVVLLLSSPVDSGVPLEEWSAPAPADVELEQPPIPLAMFTE